MLFADTVVHDTSVQVSIVTAIGLIVVAVIGVWQVKLTSGAKKEASNARDKAKSNALDAAGSAQIAKDYAAALEAKNAHIASLEERINFLEEQNNILTSRIQEIERRSEEHYEQQRAASLLEREYVTELSALRAELNRLRKN